MQEAWSAHIHRAVGATMPQNNCVATRSQGRHQVGAPKLGRRSVWRCESGENEQRGQ